jgi:hypothetical protein
MRISASLARFDPGEQRRASRTTRSMADRLFMMTETRSRQRLPSLVDDPEMSIGNRWPRPGQAAVGALDHVPVGDWPGLAARWLSLGFDSHSLRQLARLRSWETGAALALMPEALRSIGFNPAPADEEFTARCQAALDIVQRDLDVTGYGRCRVRAYLMQWPTTVFAALPDCSYWSGAWGMTREMDGTSLLFTAAASVSGTIKEVDEIEWPLRRRWRGARGAIRRLRPRRARHAHRRRAVVVYPRETCAGLGRTAHREDRQNAMTIHPIGPADVPESPRRCAPIMQLWADQQRGDASACGDP